MDRCKTLVSAALLSGLVAGGALAAAAPTRSPSAEERLRESLGDGAVQTLALVKERDPGLHKKLARALRFAFSDDFGPRRWLRVARELFADPRAREVIARNLAARHRVRELVRRYDESPEDGKAALKAELRAAVAESYEARIEAQELKERKLREHIAESRARKDERVEKIVSLIAQD